ncbi:hypothetical protein PanWU01x14_234240 [Parasponia andersonii]|uniref:Uncharacterized protein n=1 Tax=Parasponia andersonii TaxID=3476 RepID=A0A2P5BJD5_PARAD|nr:hypothetical protein PanWU01x14_234240 [Parasponia andersonii]
METTDETFAVSQLWSSSPQGAYFVAKRTISKSPFCHKGRNKNINNSDENSAWAKVELRTRFLKLVFNVVMKMEVGKSYNWKNIEED